MENRIWSGGVRAPYPWVGRGMKLRWEG